MELDGYSEFTDKLGKGNLNFSYIVLEQILTVNHLGSEDIENNEEIFNRYCNGIKQLSGLLAFKTVKDDNYKKNMELLKETKQTEIERFRNYFQLLIIKCDEYGFLPAEDISLREG